MEGKTGNNKLLQLAEDAWAIQDKFVVDETAITFRFFST